VVGWHGHCDLSPHVPLPHQASPTLTSLPRRLRCRRSARARSSLLTTACSLRSAAAGGPRSRCLSTLRAPSSARACTRPTRCPTGGRCSCTSQVRGRPWAVCARRHALMCFWRPGLGGKSCRGRSELQRGAPCRPPHSIPTGGAIMDEAAIDAVEPPPRPTTVPLALQQSMPLAEVLEFIAQPPGRCGATGGGPVCLPRGRGVEGLEAATRPQACLSPSANPSAPPGSTARRPTCSPSSCRAWHRCRGGTRWRSNTRTDWTRQRLGTFERMRCS
jgi:hypothetical protein